MYGRRAGENSYVRIYSVYGKRAQYSQTDDVCPLFCKCNICEMLKCCKWNKIEDQNHNQEKAYLILNIINNMIQDLTQTTGDLMVNDFHSYNV